MGQIIENTYNSKQPESIKAHSNVGAFTVGEHYFQDGEFELAFEYFIKIADYSRAVDSIQQLLVKRNEDASIFDLIQMIGEIPSQYAKDDARVSTFYGICYLLDNDYQLAEKRLYEALNHPVGLKDCCCKKSLAVALGILALIQKTPSGIMYFRMANHINVDDQIIKDYDILNLLTPSTLFLYDEWLGIKYESLEDTAEFIKVATTYLNKVTDNAFIGYDDLYYAKMHFDRGEFNKALVYSMKTVTKTTDKRVLDIRISALFLRMRIMIFKGEYGEFVQIHKQIHAESKNVTSHNVNITIKSIENWAYSKIYEPNSIIGNYNLNRIDIYEKPTTIKPFELINHAYMFIRREYYYDALGIVATMEEEVDEYKDKWEAQLFTNIIGAVCHYRLDNKKEAYDYLWKAYNMTYSDNIIAPYAEIGSNMRNLVNNINKYSDHDFDEDWVNTIQKKSSYYAKKLSAMRKKNQNENSNELQIHNLTKRETSVIKMLSEGFTLEEISNQLYISVSGTKKLVTGAYSKLGATNRSEAIHIATKNHII